MHPEKYSLTWHTYSDQLKNMMKELMMNEDFSDVTLVTEDKKQIKANINILSICSPVFQDILKKEKNCNQIIYLRGVQFSEMESIMQFIYLGEATFYKQRMNEFLSVANSLEIKGLCNAESETSDEAQDEPTDYSESSPADMNEQTTRLDNTKPEDELTTYPETSSANMKAETIRFDNTKKERSIEVATHSDNYACDKCDRKYSSYSSLYSHKRSVHEGVKFDCSQCDYQTSHQSSLGRHIQKVHEGVKYACDQCDYQTSDQSLLPKHIKAKHEGVRYPCDQCDYQALYKSDLGSHKRKRHTEKL